MNWILLITALIFYTPKDNVTLEISMPKVHYQGDITFIEVVLNNDKEQKINVERFELFNDTITCQNTYWQLTIKKDGINYFLPNILCHRKISRIKLKRGDNYEFKIPFRIDMLSSNAYDFTNLNYEYGEYEISLTCKLLKSNIVLKSQIVKIRYMK